MEVVKYNFDTALVTALNAKYADIKIVDTASYAFVMSGLREYRELRLSVDAEHKQLKADALKYTQGLDKKKRELKALIEPGEQHLKDIRQEEDDRKQAIKDEKDRIEKLRIDNIDMKIMSIDHAISRTLNMTSSQIGDLAGEISHIEITEEEYQEFTGKAMDVKAATLSALDDIFDEKVETERQASERKVEIEKLEKLKVEQAEAEAKMHEELRKIESAKQAAQKVIDDEREKLEAEKRAEQEKQDRAEFERKAKAQAEEQAKRQAEQEAQRKEREKAEAEKEAKRQADLLPDKEKLVAFAGVLADLKFPVVKNPKAKAVIQNAIDHIHKIATDIEEQAVTL